MTVLHHPWQFTRPRLSRSFVGSAVKDYMKMPTMNNQMQKMMKGQTTVVAVTVVLLQ
jgi:hypothetical protein